MQMLSFYSIHLLNIANRLLLNAVNIYLKNAVSLMKTAFFVELL